MSFLSWLFIFVSFALLAIVILRKSRERSLSVVPRMTETLRSAPPENTDALDLFENVEQRITEIERADFLEYMRIKDLGRLIHHGYPLRFTRDQENHVELRLRTALVRKQIGPIGWQLRIRTLTEQSTFFPPGGNPDRGLWVELDDDSAVVEFSRLVVVECQLAGGNLFRLLPRQSVIIRGRIAEVKIQWPSIHVLVLGPVSPAIQPRPVLMNPDEHLDREEETLRHKAYRSSTRPMPSYEMDRAFLGMPSYQPDILSAYSETLRRQAFELFELVRAGIGRRAKKNPGSFSFIAKSSGETAAKILIYQRGVGRENGQWPILADGVYILVRCNGRAGRAIWQKGFPPSNPYAQRLDPSRTLGIAPMRDQRFSFFPLTPVDDFSAVAELLVHCASV